MKQVTVHSPATVANVVCGFDILGFAVQYPYDEFVVSISDTPGITIVNQDDYHLPTDVEKNVSGVALLSILKKSPEIKGFKLLSKKHIKPGSGIGSSASSAAGVVVAANALLNNKFTKEQLIEFAMCGELVASGAKHADNIAPAIYGGLTLIRSLNPLDIVSIDMPPLYAVIVHPQIEVRTSDARNILKQKITLTSAIHQWANIAGLIAGCMKHDYSLIARSLEDVIVEPIRSMLIPGFEEIKKMSILEGALGGGISGSGPSLFMLCKTIAIAETVENVMKNIYNTLKVPYHTYVSTINPEGVKIISIE